MRAELPVDGSSGDKTLELDMAQVMAQAFDIFKKRQRKYGPTNISAFGDFGTVVRLTDKLARLQNLYANGMGGDSDDESVEDTWLDAANYALIGLLCHRGKWPGYTPTARRRNASPGTSPSTPTRSAGWSPTSVAGITPTKEELR